MGGGGGMRTYRTWPTNSDVQISDEETDTWYRINSFWNTIILTVYFHSICGPLHFGGGGGGTSYYIQLYSGGGGAIVITIQIYIYLSFDYHNKMYFLLLVTILH